MNEDERWALEYFKSVKVGDNFDIQKELKCREIISGLLLKQQKEIEDLKTITREYEAYKVGEGDNIVIASKKWFNDGFFIDFLNDYVSKDKIKAKIEKYNKKCDECNFNKSGICKELKAYNCCSIQSVLELLNELLGE